MPTLGEIAEFVGGDLSGDCNLPVIGVCTLKRPKPGHLAFARAAPMLEGISNIAVIAPYGTKTELPSVLVGNPRYEFARIMDRWFAPRITVPRSGWIDPQAQIGEGTIIHPGAVILGNVRIGRNCLVRSAVTIGEEGFGFERGPDGKWFRLPHIGGVIIADDVEIGAASSISAGLIDPTVIGRGTKLDAHVFVAHNCEIGEDSVLTACAELSGSVTVGDGCWIGPNASILNGITIADRCTIGIGAVVTKSTEPNGLYAGSPARRIRDV